MFSANVYNIINITKYYNLDTNFPWKENKHNHITSIMAQKKHAQNLSHWRCKEKGQVKAVSVVRMRTECLTSKVYSCSVYTSSKVYFCSAAPLHWSTWTKEDLPLWNRDVVESVRQDAEGSWPYVSLCSLVQLYHPWDTTLHRAVETSQLTWGWCISVLFAEKAAQSTLSRMAFSFHLCLSRTFHPNLLVFKPVLSGWPNRTA